MSDGTLTFSSWVRRGLGTAFSNVDGDPVGEARVPVEVEFNGDPLLVGRVNLILIGPGDITGLNRSVIVRLWPRPDDQDAESRSYPLIEFDQADLPWRYTPAKHSGSTGTGDDRLRPWFSLVVLAADEATLNPSTPEQKLQVLHVNDTANCQRPPIFGRGVTLSSREQRSIRWLPTRR